jgi:hypothetical protein
MKDEPKDMQLIPQGDRSMPLTPARPVDAVAILQAAVQGGVKSENVEVVERMMALVERQQDRQAARDYGQALANLQRECQNVIATKDVDGKFRYAPYLDLWNAVRPAVERNGFTLQWDQKHLGDKIEKILVLQHTASGHSKDFHWTMRLGSNAPGMPQGSQAPILDEITDSRAQRRLLMAALNIVVDAVSPAEDVGDGAVADQKDSDALFQRLLATGADASSQRRFLALAGAEDWTKIPKANLGILGRLLAEKERASARKATAQ